MFSMFHPLPASHILHVHTGKEHSLILNSICIIISLPSNTSKPHFHLTSHRHLKPNILKCSLPHLPETSSFPEVPCPPSPSQFPCRCCSSGLHLLLQLLQNPVLYHLVVFLLADLQQNRLKDSTAFY